MTEDCEEQRRQLWVGTFTSILRCEELLVAGLTLVGSLFDPFALTPRRSYIYQFSSTWAFHVHSHFFSNYKYLQTDHFTLFISLFSLTFLFENTDHYDTFFHLFLPVYLACICIGGLLHFLLCIGWVPEKYWYGGYPDDWWNVRLLSIRSAHMFSMVLLRP